MAANDPRIRMTVAAPNEVYRQFHAKTSRLGQKHNGVMVRLMELYVRGEVTLSFLETPPPLKKKA